MSEYFKSAINAAYIIAEIGVNHEGSLHSAFKLIDDACEAGVDAVKFQAYKAGRLAAPLSPSYWNLNEEATKSQFELFSKYDSFDAKEYKMLRDYSVQNGVEFMLTCFDLDFARTLSDLSPIMKIASADITNIPLLLAVAECAEAIVLSTGAASIEEVKHAVSLIEPFNKPISILHCVLNYPTSNEIAALNRIITLQTLFPNCIIGYSDHTKPTPGNPILNSAFVLGARVFEKHFSNTLTSPGNDHYHSMDSEMIKNWLAELSHLDNALNYTESEFLNSQTLAIQNARRGIYSSRPIKKGELFTSDNLVTLRPTSSTPSEKWFHVIGTIARRDLEKGEAIRESDYLE